MDKKTCRQINQSLVIKEKELSLENVSKTESWRNFCDKFWQGIGNPSKLTALVCLSPYILISEITLSWH